MITDPKLLNKQRDALSRAARDALDDGRPIDALALIERLPSIDSADLVTVMEAIEQDPPKHVATWAQKVFEKLLAQTVDVNQLTPGACWVYSNKRRKFPREILDAINARRRKLDPEWNGVWHDSGRDGAERIRDTFAGKQPAEVFDTAVCLNAANQSNDAEPWLARYRELGGDVDAVLYLKTKISRAVHRKVPIPGEAYADLRRLCAVGPPHEVKRFLRNMVGRKRVSGIDISFRSFALLMYCSFERVEHTVDDWVFIAESALLLRKRTLQCLAQRGLATCERTPTAQRIFEELIRRVGEVYVTQSARDDVRLQGNPIWDDIYVRIPVDANARSVLISYSQAALRDL